MISCDKPDIDEFLVARNIKYYGCINKYQR